MRALIVEDEPIFRLDLTQRLHELGFSQVKGTAYAEEALQYASGGSLDLILMDIRLKGPMTGIEAAEAIGRDYGIPIIVMSAYQVDLDELKNVVPSFCGFLPKPIDDNTLKDYCEKIVQH